MTNVVLNKSTFQFWGPLLVLLLIMTGCKDNITQGTSDMDTDADMAYAVAKQNNNSGETAYADGGTGLFAGYNETNCPDYGIYEYTLWAGKTNDAGTVTITNDDQNIYVTYNTNGTADLGEVHVYLWENTEDIPDKRPAPGQAPYTAENINADSYTVTIPMNGISCGSTFYISTHAALVADESGDDGSDDGSSTNAGETAYAGGSNTGDGFDSAKGAWWGYVTYQVECYFDITGSVYEDLAYDGNLDGGEALFAGITVNLMDGSGAVVATTTTDADGSYLFEHVPGGDDYSVALGSAPQGDYLANENAGGFAITALDDCLNGIDFGFVPLYDISGTVYDDANNSFDNEGETGFAGITVTLLDENGNAVATTTTDSQGNYLFENNLPGDYTIVVVGPAGYDATENDGGASLTLSGDTTGIDFGFYQEPTTYDPCDTNTDGTVSDAEYNACHPGTGDDFPTWAQDISHVTLVFEGPAGDRDGDGYLTIKIDEWPSGMDPDLDNSIDQILAWLIANDANVDASSVLLGSSIKGGIQITAYYAYGDGDNGSDTPPAGLGFGFTGGSDNETNQNNIDWTYDYSVIF